MSSSNNLTIKCGRTTVFSKYNTQMGVTYVKERNVKHKTYDTGLLSESETTWGYMVK